MASLEKWVDELQAAVDKLTKRVANVAASAFKPEIETPTAGQVIIYDAEDGWKNGDVFTPEFTDPTDGQAVVYDATAGKWVNGTVIQPEVNISEVVSLDNSDVSTIETPISLSDGSVVNIDSTTHSQVIRLKSGAGTFTSYFTTDKQVDLTPYDAVDVSILAGGSTRYSQLDVSSYTGKYRVGAYYETDSNGFAVGVALFYENIPGAIQTKIQLYAGTGASGNIDVYKMVFTEPEQATRKKTTKKGGTK